MIPKIRTITRTADGGAVVEAVLVSKQTLASDVLRELYDPENILDPIEMESRLPTLQDIIGSRFKDGFKNGELTILPELLESNVSRSYDPKSALTLHLGLQRIKSAREFDENFVGPVKEYGSMEKKIRRAIIDQYCLGPFSLENTSALTFKPTNPN